MLGQTVHAIREALLVLHIGPSGGEAVISLAAQKQRTSREQFLAFKGLAALGPERHGPSRMLEIMGGTRRLHHAVERQKFTDNELAHFSFAFSVSGRDQKAVTVQREAVSG